ncbi:hypothetical protein [Arsenicicoccus sp. oral taxon 190]|uniref:hypothetical protein n=1 Tax=Arsenicicoccus sp. oral taxon 190 TaxID=1658671 RepID=UPI00067A39DC|nr:hypothetical protein [Arsenicicoccus sp. oral taxon 190]AKT50725.1 hypothetical protein ADJ73_04310 [Arsenicicoccus sp. oral taxon 190]
MNRTLSTTRIVVTGAFAIAAALGTAGTAAASGHSGAPTDTVTTQAAKGPHAEEADGSDHGASGKPAKADPNPGKGKDCVQHGNHGGINEDHCGPVQPKPEQPKPEQPKPEQPKPEHPKPEHPKPEQPKPEQPGDGQCPICRTVTPPAPVVTPVCGADNDEITLPAAEGVIWERGTWADGTIVIKAISADHYTFPTGDVVEYVFKDAAESCNTPAPTPSEDCDHTCPTPPVTPGGEQPTPVTPTTPAKPATPVTPAPVKPAPVKPAAVKPAGVVVPVTVVSQGTPVAAPTAAPVAPAKATVNGAPVFNSGVEGDASPSGLGLGAGALALLGAALVVPAARRRQHA